MSYSADPENKAELEQLSSDMAESIKKVHGQFYIHGEGAPTLYPCSGTSGDWAYLAGMKINYGVELRDTGNYGFMLPESQIKPTCEENIAGLEVLFNHVRPVGMPCKNVVCMATMPNSECKYDSSFHTVQCQCQTGFTPQGGQCIGGSTTQCKSPSFQ